MTIENPDNEIDYLSYEREINNLKKNIESGFNEENLRYFARNTIWVDDGITWKYISALKGFYKSNKIPDVMDKKFKEELWFKSDKLINSKLSHSAWLTLFYIKESCPNNFEKIAKLLLDNYVFNGCVININIDDHKEWYRITGGQDLYSMKQIIKFIGEHWDSSYDCLKFCSPFGWSYIQKWMSTVSNDGKDAFKRFGGTIQFIENFIQEQKPNESMNLFSFLKENPQKLKNLWWEKIKEIDLDVSKWINFAFRGIIQMVNSRSDLSFPHLSKNASESEKRKWKEKRENIIKEYELMLQNYISEDKNKQKETTYDKIFFSTQLWDGIINQFPVGKDDIQNFSLSKVLDYSQKNSEDTYPIGKQRREWQARKEKMISDIENYVFKNPGKKVLVCIDYHGNPDWTSENWWTKKDWERLAIISPNVKIWSIRCFFGKAFNNIYSLKSSVSWFSNYSATHLAVWEVMASGLKQWLWFNELEIYTRLNYPFSAAPLTMRYKGRNVWIAQNDEENNEEHDDQDIDYA